MARQPIVILGAGLAGLTLGQCLRQKGIPAVLLEKMSSSPRYSYGITLYPRSYQPLCKTMKVDEATFREKLSVDAKRGGAGSMTDHNIMPNPAGTFRCHRGRLEILLREGQDIRWEHRVQDMQLSGIGITLKLADQDPMEASMLMGTDGVHSISRKSLAPDIALSVLPYVVFSGVRRMTLAEFQHLIEPEMQHHAIIEARHGDIVLGLAINDYTATFVDLSYTYSRSARPNDSLHKPERPISGATDIPEAFYTELEQLKGLGKAFTEIFSNAKVRRDRVLHWLMRSTLGTPSEVKRLADQGILLIGDAFHAMPIIGGEGANIAIEDGIELAEHLARHGSDNLDAFLNKRYDIWEKSVQESEERLAKVHSLEKSSL